MISLHGRVVRGELTLDFDAEIAPGVSHVVGANGAGKTTLLRVLAGLEALDAGELRIDGLSMDEPATRHFVPTHERPIAFAFQDHRLFPHLSVIDNVAFPARRRGRSRHDARHEALPHLETVGIGELARRMPGELSIGQRQRTAIARALATPATVLLLDEPLAAIDEASRATIRDRLRGAAHPTVVWVSHDPDDVDRGSRLISVTDGAVRQTR
ncbi:MAG: ATP-binding cassette domain-containing protein [Acidimicrobiales bacterium]